MTCLRPGPEENDRLERGKRQKGDAFVTADNENKDSSME